MTWASWTGPERRELILASGSPQRRAILEQIGVSFEVVSRTSTSSRPGRRDEVVLENAYRKAAGRGERELPVLGVDTVVSLGLRIFGKPDDEAHAESMLGDLASRRHVVVSGICLIGPEGRTRTAAAETVVEFRALDAAAIAAYVAHRRVAGAGRRLRHPGARGDAGERGSRATTSTSSGCRWRRCSIWSQG